PICVPPLRASRHRQGSIRRPTLPQTHLPAPRLHPRIPPGRPLPLRRPANLRSPARLLRILRPSARRPFLRSRRLLVPLRVPTPRGLPPHLRSPRDVLLCCVPVLTPARSCIWT